MRLKTLKDFKCGCVSCGECMSEHKSPMEVDTEELKQEAIKWIKDCQSGCKNFNRNVIPETMKGTIAKSIWNDGKFSLGCEYGAIAILIQFFNINKRDLKC